MYLSTDRYLIKQDADGLDERSKQLLQKFAKTAQMSFAECAFFYDEIDSCTQYRFNHFHFVPQGYCGANRKRFASPVGRDGPTATPSEIRPIADWSKRKIS
jgi:hypothetical protein